MEKRNKMKKESTNKQSISGGLSGGAEAQKKMKALPTSWRYRSGKYLIDINYSVWDMEGEEKVYQDTNTGEYSLQDVMEGRVHWDNNPAETLYTIEDWIMDFDQERENLDGLEEK